MREGYCSRPVCVCVCFRGPHLQLTQHSDKVGILAVLVSCSLVFKKGSFSYNGKIAVAFPYGSWPFLYAKRAHFPHSFRILYYARDFTRAVNLYAHV